MRNLGVDWTAERRGVEFGFDHGSWRSCGDSCEREGCWRKVILSTTG